MSSPHISFRLNHYQLARALRILVTLEPNQPIASLSQMAKLIIIDWISKHSINTDLNVAAADIEAIKLISTLNVDQIDPYITIKSIMEQARQKAIQYEQSANNQANNQATQIRQKSEAQIKRELEEEKLFNQLKRESLDQKRKVQLLDDQIENNIEESKILSVKPSEFHDPNKTDSKISILTDFSPPKDWINQE